MNEMELLHWWNAAYRMHCTCRQETIQFQKKIMYQTLKIRVGKKIVSGIVDQNLCNRIYGTYPTAPTR